MEQTYPVFLGSAVCGQVQLHREGLYVRICCRCSILDGKIYTLMAQGEKSLPIGVPVPANGLFHLRKRIPARNLEEGTLRFFLQERSGDREQNFYPVEENCPLPFLADLLHARMVRVNDQVGVMLDREK